jgi:hypothetical protein
VDFYDNGGRINLTAFLSGGVRAKSINGLNHD